MPKIEIEVDQILTCVVNIEAEPGDKILVMNGVVIGMVESPRKRNSPPPPPPSSPPSPMRPTPSSIPEKTTTKNYNVNQDVKESDITSLLEQGEMTTRKIAEILNLNTLGRTRLKSLMKKMQEHKRIAKANDRRFPSYKIA